MTKIKKYFGEFNMTWLRVILLAIITAVYTAVVNLIPIFKDTSFQDIAVVIDCWFLFAIFIIVNCDKWWEAALKCFVFFLISQPLIYLIEVPFNSVGWGLFRYYDYWFKITLLTLPGAAVAFLVKKKNWLSVLVLSVATGYLACSGVDFFETAINNFPRHLLSAIFCFALAVFFIFVLLDEKKHRAAALGIFAAVAIAVTVFFTANSGGAYTEIILDEGDWTYTVEGDDIFDVEITDGNRVAMKSTHNGYTIICFENADGEKVEYGIVADGKNFQISIIN